MMAPYIVSGLGLTTQVNGIYYVIDGGSFKPDNNSTNHIYVIKCQ